MACQHAISTAVAPAMITHLADTIEARIRLRSANRDECLTMVLTGQAGVAVVYYPEDVYLGKVFRQEILPILSQRYQVRWNAETGLTTAAAELARSGAGVAWVPRSLVATQLEDRSLVLAGSKLPSERCLALPVELKRSVTVIYCGSAVLPRPRVWLVCRAENR